MSSTARACSLPTCTRIVEELNRRVRIGKALFPQSISSLTQTPGCTSCPDQTWLITADSHPETAKSKSQQTAALAVASAGPAGRDTHSSCL